VDCLEKILGPLNLKQNFYQFANKNNKTFFVQ